MDAGCTWEGLAGCSGVPWPFVPVASLQIMDMSVNKPQIETKVNATILDFANRGLRGLGVARQVRI